MKVLIITGGRIDDDFASSFLSENIYNEVIAVDGGLAYADRAKIGITHLVGDFDTIESDILEAYMHEKNVCVHQYVPEKDFTDTDIAVNLAVSLVKENSDEESEIHLLGATGTRLDHVMANLQMLKRIMESGIRGVIVDKHNYIEMICGERCLEKGSVFGKYMSLIPASQKLEGLTLKGFKYPLLNAETSFGESLCVSNELVEDEGRITIGEGMAWMILSRD